jgi:hypothetical protein
MGIPNWALNPGVSGCFSGTVPESGLPRRIRWEPRQLSFVYGFTNWQTQPSVIREAVYRFRPQLMNIRFDFMVDTHRVHIHYPSFPTERLAVPMEVLAIQAGYWNEIGDGATGPNSPHILIYAPIGLEFYFCGLNQYVNF